MSATKKPDPYSPARTQLDRAIINLMQEGGNSPLEIAHRIMKEFTTEWRISAYEEIESWIISERAREFFRGMAQQPTVAVANNGSKPFGTPHKSAKQQAIEVGSAYVHVPSRSGYVLVAECTASELREGAVYLEKLRDGLEKRIDALYALASRLDEAGVKTWKDLKG